MTDSTPTPAQSLEALKACAPCPWCDKVPLQPWPLMKIEGTWCTHNMHCENCGADGPTARDQSQAVELWNRRPSPAPTAPGESEDWQHDQATLAPVLKELREKQNEVVALREQLAGVTAERDRYLLTLQQAASDLECGDGDETHYCSRCDNSLFNALQFVRASLPASADEGRHG